MIRYIALLLLTASGGFSAVVDVPQRQQHVLVAENEIAPGVGFDLTAFYGTVAISYANGTKLPIGKVEGSDQYREVMQRLSRGSSQHIAPPYLDLNDAYKDWPRQEIRKWRKKIGLPASADVGVLAKMMVDLKEKANNFLDSPMDFVVVTILHLVAIYSEDISDAIEHAGLHSTKLWFFDHLIYEETSSYAGNGLGLCEHFDQPGRCLNETYSHPREEVHTVLYTRDALKVAISFFSGAYYLGSPLYLHRLDFDLGSDKVQSLTAQEDIDEYWRSVRQTLTDVAVRRKWRRFDRVMLMGESAAMPEFRAQLEGAMSSVLDEMPLVNDADPLYVAAKGAAELAMRAPWTDEWWHIEPNTTRTVRGQEDLSLR
ncbi:Hypothetical protein D9617_22g067020 [Elsinoe fawcettii]|nr:Hypothetical protein D9617_22g067020 [Elsinoe fawcettii]